MDLMQGRHGARMGRPPEFTDRVRLHVFLERRELLALQRLAAARGVSASHLARRTLLDLLASTKGGRHAR